MAKYIFCRFLFFRPLAKTGFGTAALFKLCRVFLKWGGGGNVYPREHLVLNGSSGFATARPAAAEDACLK